MRCGPITLSVALLFSLALASPCRGDDPPSPPVTGARFQTMTAAAEVGTDDPFQELKKERAFVPDAVAPVALRSLMKRPELTFRTFWGMFHHTDGKPALVWRGEAESDHDMDDLSARVHTFFREAEFVRGTPATDSTTQMAHSSLSSGSRFALPFQRERDGCREVVLVGLNDNRGEGGAGPDARVILTVHWTLFGPLDAPPVTHAELIATFPMLRGTDVDPPILAAVAKAPVSELSTSLQVSTPKRLRNLPFTFLPGGWQLISRTDLRPTLPDAFAAAGFTAGEDRPGRARMWKTAEGGTASLSYSDRSMQTRVSLSKYPVTERPPAPAPAPAQPAPAAGADKEPAAPLSPAVSPPASPLAPVPPLPRRLRVATLRPDVPLPATPPEESTTPPLSVAAALRSMVERAEVGTDRDFDAHRQEVGLAPGTTAPRGLRECLIRPELALAALRVEQAVDDSGLTVSWSAGSWKSVADPETLADRIHAQIEPHGFRRIESPRLTGTLPRELALLTQDLKLVRVYQREGAGPAESVILAVAGASRFPHPTLAIVWSVESPKLDARPTLSATFEGLPVLRPEGVDPQILAALGDGPFDSWRRSLETTLRRSLPLGRSPFRVGEWAYQGEQDLGARVSEALKGAGFEAAQASGAARESKVRIERWKQGATQIDVSLFPSRPDSPSANSSFRVSGQTRPANGSSPSL